MAKERASNVLTDLFNPGRKTAPARDTPALPSMASSRSPSPERRMAPQSESAHMPNAGAGVALSAEHQEGLIERVLKASRGKATPLEAEKDLAELHQVLAGLSQKTVIVVFAMGKLLAEVKSQLSHGEFIPWIECVCPFNRASAWNYMKIYEHYKDEPRRALAELSITEAYIEAGVKKLAAPEKDDGDETKIRGSGSLLEGEPGIEEFAAAFRRPPLSGVPLKHYRIEPYRNGTLYMVRPEIGVLPVCNLYVNMANPDLAYQAAITKAHQDMQLALEVFFSKVEELEERGVIPAPFDTSRKAMVNRMRNVSPEAERPAKTAGKTKAAGKAAKKEGKR